MERTEPKSRHPGAQPSTGGLKTVAKIASRGPAKSNTNNGPRGLKGC